jgi:hypothetical protein
MAFDGAVGEAARNCGKRFNMTANAGIVTAS